MQLSQRLHNSPKLVITSALALIIGSTILMGYTDSNRATPVRKFAVSQNTSSDLRPASDVLSTGTTNASARFLFNQRGSAKLIGRGVTAASGEFQSPTTQLSITTDTGETQITDKPVEYSQLSHDGTKIIYITASKITYLYDIATKTEQQLTNKASFLPDLSRDNTQIVYKELPTDWSPGSDYTNSRGLVIKNITTTNETLITNYNTNLQPTDPDYSFVGEPSYAPTFSPDGTQVVYFSGSTTANIGGMFIINTDGTNKTRLTNNNQKSVTTETIPSISDSPLWSPDGTQFIYESNNRIYRTQIDRQNRRLIKAEKVADGIAPSWVEGREGSELKVQRRGGGESKVNAEVNS